MSGPGWLTWMTPTLASPNFIYPQPIKNRCTLQFHLAFLWGLLGIQTHTSPSLFIDTTVAELHSHSCRARTRATTENPLHNPNVEDQHFINLPYNGCVTSITENIPSKEHFSHPLRRISAEGTGHSLHGFYNLAPDFLVSLTSQYRYLSAPTQSLILSAG